MVFLAIALGVAFFQMKQAQHGNQQQHANADGDDEQADFSSIDFDGRRFRRIALLRTLHEVLPPTVAF